MDRGLGLRPAAAWLVLLPIGAAAWAFMHASGIHATIAGVLLGFTIPVLHRKDAPAALRDRAGLAEDFEHRFRPLSAGFAVPVFAFFAAGVNIGGWEGARAALVHPLALAILAALVIGKPVGIVTTTWLVTRLTRSRLDPDMRWIDLTGVGLLAGIGFTVSLLVAELSFAPGSVEHGISKAAVLAASLISATLAAALLGLRNRQYRRINARDSLDENSDGIPDVYQRTT